MYLYLQLLQWTSLINTSPQSVITFIDYIYACKLQCGTDWDYFVIPACCDNCELKVIKQQNIAMYGVTEPPNCNCNIFNSMHMYICGIGSVIILWRVSLQRVHSSMRVMIAYLVEVLTMPYTCVCSQIQTTKTQINEYFNAIKYAPYIHTY